MIDKSKNVWVEDELTFGAPNNHIKLYKPMSCVPLIVAIAISVAIWLVIFNLITCSSPVEPTYSDVPTPVVACSNCHMNMNEYTTGERFYEDIE